MSDRFPPNEQAKSWEYVPRYDVPRPKNSPSARVPLILQTPRPPPPPAASAHSIPRPASSAYSEYSPGPHPASLAYSEYVPLCLDTRGSDRILPRFLSAPRDAPQRPAATADDPPTGWVPPIVRGRDQPFPPPVGREYPVSPPAQHREPPAPAQPPICGLPILPDIRPPRRRIERGRGIVRSATVGGEDLRKRADMYFDYEVGEWRPIPSYTQLGVPEENWGEAKRESEGDEGSPKGESEGDEGSPKGKKRDKLKQIGNSLFQVVKDLKNPQAKQDRVDGERRAKLAASISGPLGTSRPRKR